MSVCAGTRRPKRNTLLRALLPQGKDDGSRYMTDVSHVA